MLENDMRELLIVKANYKNYWTLPGGIVDHDETPKQAAIREVFEEVGITLNPDQVSFVAVVDRISSQAQTYQFIFKAVLPVSAKEAIILQTSEIDDYALVSRSQILAGDRMYAKAIQHWANNVSGYVEQTFTEG